MLADEEREAEEQKQVTPKAPEIGKDGDMSSLVQKFPGNHLLFGNMFDLE